MFLDAMKNRVLLFDGAMGTEIQRHDPQPEDFPNNQDGFNDGLVIRILNGLNKFTEII